MTNVFLDQEMAIRLTCFGAVLAGVAAWELFAPRRVLNNSRVTRWPSNLALVALNTAVLRVMFPIAAVGMAGVAVERGWGVLNILAVADWLAVLVAIILLDLAIYTQHVVVHAVPVLWRLHRMHHTDLDYDVTTGSRFHPIEIILSMLIKIGIVFLLGVTPEVVLIFEITLNLTAMFNHGNIYLPGFIDKYLRLLVVTPDMHRVHHSVFKSETNSNYGFNFPWWDRIFGTYLHQPQNGHLNMKIGLTIFNNPENLHLHKMLIQPFLAAHKSDD